MKLGKVRFSWDVIKEALHMPEDTSIRDCEFDVRQLTLTVEHDDLEEVEDINPIPFYRPIVGREVEEFITKHHWNWR